MMRFNVTMESHPPAVRVSQVAVLFEAVYVVPCQLRLSHAEMDSVLLTVLLMMRFKVTIESQPAVLSVSQMAVLLDEVKRLPCQL